MPSCDTFIALYIIVIFYFKGGWVSSAWKHLRWTSGLTSQYSVIASLKFSFMQRQSHVYIPYTLFSGSLYFFLMFHSYHELVIITLQFAFRNMFSRFFTFNHCNWRSKQPWHIDWMFSQTLCKEKTHNIDINTCIK